MSDVQDFENIIESFSRAEKTGLLKWIVQYLGDAHAGIDSSSGVCGGEPRIVRTRIPVWLLEQAKRLGANDAKLLWFVCIQLHSKSSAHEGIIVCTFDTDFHALALRIHEQISTQKNSPGS